MDFEFIEESEIEYSKRGGNGQKKEKTESLFDESKYNRTYWGKELGIDGEYYDDLGTKINVCLTHGAIRRSIRNRILLDIDDYYLSARLNKEYRDELRKYQLMVLEEMIFSQFKNVSFVMDNEMVTHIVVSD